MIAQPGSSPRSRRRRTPRRAALLLAAPVAVPAAAVATLWLAAGSAAADTPSRWEQAPSVSPLHFLAVLILIPVALILVIAGLVWVGTRGSAARSAELEGWQQSTWFGAPTKGTTEVDTVDEEAVARSEKGGGASVRW